MTLKVTIFGVVHAHHVRWGVPKGLMENVVVDLGTTWYLQSHFVWFRL